MVLQEGDTLVFNHNVWHRGTKNNGDSTCMFIYADTRPGFESGVGFEDASLRTESEHKKICSESHPASRRFIYKEALSFLELPTILNNACRDPVYLENIGN